MIAAILHIGNIEFAKGEEIDSSVVKDEKSRFHLNTTAELLRFVSLSLIHFICVLLPVFLDIPTHSLMDINPCCCRCDAGSLENALIKRVMVTPEEIITRTLDPDSALVSRDALAKTIYSRLFDW